MTEPTDAEIIALSNWLGRAMGQELPTESQGSWSSSLT